MGIRVLKPNTNAQRNTSINDRSQVTAKKPAVKSLLRVAKKVTGRSKGTITIRHRGGGIRSRYRMVDFNGTDKLGVPGVINEIEYDPKRTAFLSLVVFKDGDKRYQLAHRKAKVGDEVVTDIKAKAQDGNRMQLQNIPVGFSIYNLEVTPNKGGQAVRSAGQKATLVSLEGEKAQVKLSSGEVRLVEKTNYATIGVVSNEEHALVKVGKAGSVRHKGRRPQVRGKAMNPCDHPHGGGEGGCPIGMKYPKTPWGAHALGVKTRKNNKASSKSILVSRHRAKAKK
ncbi:50S ribosomal protein L2 [Candidatus Gracilibacteria bacterium]|nr:50S ribosomal protein L2 [Candidatus Gracilibacteria bacterium]